MSERGIDTQYNIEASTLILHSLMKNPRERVVGKVGAFLMVCTMAVSGCAPIENPNTQQVPQNGFEILESNVKEIVKVEEVYFRLRKDGMLVELPRNTGVLEEVVMYQLDHLSEITERCIDNPGQCTIDRSVIGNGDDLLIVFGEPNLGSPQDDPKLVDFEDLQSALSD